MSCGLPGFFFLFFPTLLLFLFTGPRIQVVSALLNWPRTLSLATQETFPHRNHLSAYKGKALWSISHTLVDVSNEKKKKKKRSGFLL